MQFSKRTVSALIFVAIAMMGHAAWAINESSPMHWSGDKTYWDRKTSHVQLIGHAAVHQPGETLTADVILLDLENRIIDARGHAVYIASGSVIYGEEMHFNLDTRTGSVVWGRVSNDSFTLTGERINKLGPTRFQTHNGEYSTCKDCPHSWTLTGADVDLQMEGYGFFKDVTGKVKDAPLFWMPYLVVPLKTKRQTGILFPHFAVVNGEFNFVQPFFWAINRSSDMTFGIGNYGGLGSRFEWEGRYNLGGRSSAQINFYNLHDKTFDTYLLSPAGGKVANGLSSDERWAVNLSQTQGLPFGIDEKLRILEVSDNLYPSKIGDIPGNQEAFLTSDLSFSHTTNQASTYVTGRRYRNMLFSDPDPRKFDPGTVQVFPQAVVRTNDRFLLDGPVAGGVSFGVTNFTRTGRTFDRDQFSGPNASTMSADTPARLGQDPLRKATRLEVSPTLYTTFRPWDVLSLVPSAQYRQYYYSFHQVTPNLSRAYLLLQADLSTQFERIYDTPSDPNSPKSKHLIRPIFTYSMIPYVREPGDHPFIQQIQYARRNSFSGYNFDNEDIVPIDSSGSNSNYFTPQGNALAYGFTTQLIRRRSPLASSTSNYQHSVELQTGQSINFRELRKEGESSQPYSRFFSLLTLEFDKWGGGVNYFYYPYGPTGGPEGQGSSRNVYSASTYYNFEKTTKQRVFAFERSVGLNYSYDREAAQSQTQNLRASGAFSINDYLLPRLTISYDFVRDRWQEIGSSLSVANPSQCWKFDLNLAQSVATSQDPATLGQERWDTHFGFSFSFNLAGTGFGGLTEGIPGAH